MKRYHEEKPVMKRQRAVMEMCQRHLYGRTESPRVDDRFKPLGRYRKKHALDCGRTRCGICHREKSLHKNDGRARDKLRQHYQEAAPEVFHPADCHCVDCVDEREFDWWFEPAWERDWCDDECHPDEVAEYLSSPGLTKEERRWLYGWRLRAATD